MSNVVSALVQKRKVGSPTRKAILMFMASCASDDGTGVWSSKATMARDLEMGKRTVQVSIDDLVSQGLISEVGTRSCAHGFTVEYRMNLDAICALEPTNPNGVRKDKSGRSDIVSDRPKQTGAGDAPVQDVHPTGAGDAPQDVQDVHPNLTGTVQEPMCAADAAHHTNLAFQEFWKAYPRPRDRNQTEQAFTSAIASGADPSGIISAAKAYAKEQAGNGRTFMAYSDTWLVKRRWEDHADAQPRSAGGADVAMFWANRIKAGKPVHGNPINAGLAREMIGRGLVSAAELQSAGIAA